MSVRTDAATATIVLAAFVVATADAAPVDTTIVNATIVVDDASLATAAAVGDVAPIVCVCVCARVEAPWDHLNSEALQF